MFLQNRNANNNFLFPSLSEIDQIKDDLDDLKDKIGDLEDILEHLPTGSSAEKSLEYAGSVKVMYHFFGSPTPSADNIVRIFDLSPTNGHSFSVTPFNELVVDGGVHYVRVIREGCTYGGSNDYTCTWDIFAIEN